MFLNPQRNLWRAEDAAQPAEGAGPERVKCRRVAPGAASGGQAVPGAPGPGGGGTGPPRGPPAGRGRARPGPRAARSVARSLAARQHMCFCFVL